MFGAHISQLAHFEVTPPDLAASVAFYRDVLGMEVSAQKPGSVWLRGWGESFHHALQLTAGDAPGVAHIGWRAISEATLNAAAAMLEETEWGRGWVPATQGHGRAFRYVSPGGHSHEIFWEVDRFKPPPGRKVHSQPPATVRAARLCGADDRPHHHRVKGCDGRCGLVPRRDGPSVHGIYHGP